MTDKKALRVQDYIEHMLGAIERIGEAANFRIIEAA
jgi:hypothetical protein